MAEPVIPTLSTTFGGYPLQITHLGVVAQRGSDQWRQLIGDTHMDLSKAGSAEGVDSDSWCYYEIQPALAEWTYEFGVIRGPGRAFVALYQDAIKTYLQSMYQRELDVPVSGVYDCKTAQYAQVFAQVIRQIELQNDSFMIGPADLAYALTSSESVLQYAREAANLVGRPAPQAVFAQLPNLGGGLEYGYAPPPVDPSCGFVDTLYYYDLPGESPEGGTKPPMSGTSKLVIGAAIAGGLWVVSKILRF